MNLKKLHIAFAFWGVIFIGINPHLIAQSPYFKEYNAGQGLPFVQIYALHQDSLGFIWAGGYGGLARFDGNEFEVYGAKSGLNNSRIVGIGSDKHGSLWVATPIGVNRFEKGKFTSLEFIESTGIREIQNMTVLGDHLFLVDEYKVLVYHVVDSSHYVFSLPEKENNRINAIAHRGKELFFATNKGVYTIRKKTGFEKATFFDFVSDKKISALVFPTLTSGLLAEENGVWLFNENESQFIPIQSDFIGKQINSINISPNNTIWICSEKGVVELKNKKQQFIQVGDHPASNEIITSFTDRENNLWLGTYYGLYKVSGSGFRNFSSSMGFPAYFIYQIFRDSQNRMWIGTREKGVVSMHNNAYRSYSVKDGLPSNNAQAIVEVNDTLYIGTSKGLAFFHNNKVKRVDKNHLLYDKSIHVFLKRRNGDLVFGSNSCIYIRGKNGIEHIHVNSTIENQVVYLFEDSQERLWICTYQGGLFMWQKEKLIPFSDSLNGVQDNNFMAALEDNKKNLWFATFQGLVHYNPQNKTTQIIDKEHGLSSDLLYSLLLSKDSNTLWIGSNQGVNTLHLDSFYNNHTYIRVFGEEDGFTGIECNTNGAFVDIDSTYWFGTVNGLIHFDPSSHKIKEMEPQLHIAGFKLINEDTALIDGAKLSYSENNLTLYYKGIYHTNPRSVFYKYRLLGFNDEWSSATRLQEVSFSNLLPGKYTFELISSSSNNSNWNKVPLRFTFYILGPWWKNIYFQISALLILIICVFLLVRWRILRIKQTLNTERKLDQLKLQALRSQMNPHFLFNSLNSIQQFINTNEKKSANIYLAKFSQLMRLILDNSRSQSVSLSKDIEALEIYLQLEALRFEDKFEYQLIIDENLYLDELRVPPMLIQPFVENAILHGFAGISYKGLIEIHLKENNSFIDCIIKDNGIGREEAKKIKIRKGKSIHKASGLEITQDRMKTINALIKRTGEIVFEDLFDENAKPSGTLVKIKIPKL